MIVNNNEKTYYYRGLSSDTKPALGEISTGSRFLEIDTGKRFMFNGTEWIEFVGTGSGGSSEPAEYLKKAEVEENKLTLTNKDGSTVEFEPAKYDDTEIKESIAKKQDILEAGDNITIDGAKISAVDTALTARVDTLETALPNKADLVDGKVPSSQLPASVDEVVEYDSLDKFPETGASNIIYVAKDTNITYRWSGTGYVAIGNSLALGETSSTAYAGDKGKLLADTMTTKQDKLTAGDNITIDENNKISAVDTVYDDTEVKNSIAGKQDKLTAGDYIELDENNISVNLDDYNAPIGFDFVTNVAAGNIAVNTPISASMTIADILYNLLHKADLLGFKYMSSVAAEEHTNIKKSDTELAEGYTGPTAIADNITESETGIVSYYTTSSEGMYIGYAFNASLGDLAHIYNNDLTSEEFDLIDSFDKKVVYYGKVQYYLYEYTAVAALSNDKFQFVFKA